MNETSTIVSVEVYISSVPRLLETSLKIVLRLSWRLGSLLKMLRNTQLSQYTQLGLLGIPKPPHEHLWRLVAQIQDAERSIKVKSFFGFA